MAAAAASARRRASVGTYACGPAVALRRWTARSQLACLPFARRRQPRAATGAPAGLTRQRGSPYLGSALLAPRAPAARATTAPTEPPPPLSLAAAGRGAAAATPGSPSKQRSRPAPPNLYRMIYDPDIVKNLFVRILLLFIITLVTHKQLATPFKLYYGLETIDGDGFGVMQAVVGLVFSVMIGQTYE